MIDTNFNGIQILGTKNDERAKLWLKSMKNLYLAAFWIQKVACAEFRLFNVPKVISVPFESSQFKFGMKWYMDWNPVQFSSADAKQWAGFHWKMKT